MLRSFARAVGSVVAEANLASSRGFDVGPAFPVHIAKHATALHGQAASAAESSGHLHADAPAQSPVAEEEVRQVVGAAIIERYPIVFPPLPEWELNYLEWQSKWNAWKYKQLPQDYLYCDKDADETSETAKFQAEPIVTEADRANDVHSLRRNTPGYLYLVTKAKGSKHWTFPSASNRSDESLRETVLRALHETVGNSIEVELMGNMPCAHVQRKADTVFFMHGLVLDGNVKLRPSGESAGVRDFAWLTKDELLADHSSDADMLKVIDSMLVK